MNDCLKPELSVHLSDCNFVVQTPIWPRCFDFSVTMLRSLKCISYMCWPAFGVIMKHEWVGSRLGSSRVGLLFCL